MQLRDLIHRWDILRIMVHVWQRTKFHGKFTESAWNVMEILQTLQDIILTCCLAMN